MTHTPVCRPAGSVGGCGFVPPYVLEALAVSGDPHLEHHARVTLEHDARLRLHRHGSALELGRGGPPAVRGDVRAVGAPGSAAGATGSAAGPTAATPAPRRTVSDARSSEDLPGVVVRTEGQPAVEDVSANEAYDGLGATWELYWAAYGRDSLDGRGLPLLATVHYGLDYDNAFWDGSQMVFGDGDGEVFLRFTGSLDVIGHELTHGVTQFTSGLNYQGQSGALNESVSDVFGVLTAQRLRGQSADETDWLLGADLLAPGVAGVALRSLKAPGTAYDDPRLGRDPQPSRMSGFVVTAEDNGGVHVNSGIPNHAFYLFATALGGNAWEVPGRVWYDTITGDIRADCDFATFARLTLAAAERRHGAGSRERAALEEAWREVEVLAPAVLVGGADLPGPESSGSGDEPGADEPADDEPADGVARDDGAAAASPQTEVEVRRTGGVAGVTRARRVTLAELPDPDTERWQRLLTEGVLRRLAARAEAAEAAEPAAHRDTFCYGVRCERPALDVSLPEPVLDHDVKGLLDRTLRHRPPAT
jgi:hypothetical protein